MDTTDYSPLLRSTLYPTPQPVSTTRPARHRLRRMLARIAGGTLGAIAILAAAGAIYETIAASGDASAYLPTGRLIDVGGYRLHLDCRGAGSPTIVMDAGLSGSSLDWILVQSELANGNRVCSYDRAGMGWSEPGPAPRSPAQIADELHTLLRNSDVPGPYVLVGHSLGGKTVRMFALAHPSEIAGMVLVDARSERIDAQMSETEVEGFTQALNGQATLYTVARRFGLVRLLGGPLLVGEPLVPPDLAQEMVLLQTTSSAVAETLAEGLARADNDAELADSTLGAMPLVIVAAADNMSNLPGWPVAQQALAALSSKGRLVVADSGHYVQLEQPNVVIDAVRSVLAEASAGSPD
jgi:pimeloyl-ACP methyl ester carboxylesterase